MATLWQQLVEKLYAAGWRLRSLPSLVVEGIIEKVFAITKPAGMTRLRVRDALIFVVILFILLWHWDIVRVTGFGYYWHQIGGSWFAKILGVLIFGVPRYFGKLIAVFFMPNSMRLWLLLILPYFLGRYAAVRYLEDIYEVSDALKSTKAGLKVAQEFLLRAIFAHGYGRVREKRTGLCRVVGWIYPAFCPTMEECIEWEQTCHAQGTNGKSKSRWSELGFGCRVPRGCSHVLSIVGGEIKDRQSPLLLIGGPGYVFISSDSAALFEKPDGTSRVLGPITNRLHLIEGFERVRRIVNLREHKMTLSARARSRDGLPIEVKDVQILFGIYRGGRKPDKKAPYPFAPMALEQLVYNERATPVSDRWEQLASSRLLTDAMRAMARVELLKFIRSQTVVEFLASVAYGDVEQLSKAYREVATELAGVQLAPPEEQQETLPPLPAPASFVWRPDIGALFDQMVNGPSGQRARQRGVGLQWIGLGAWHTPVTKVIDQHTEVWRISVENMLRSSPIVLAQLERERRVSAFVERVRTLLGWFQNSEGQPPAQRERVLLDYFVRWLEWGALAYSNETGEVPDDWQAAIAYLRTLLLRTPDQTPLEDGRAQGEPGNVLDAD